MTDIHAQQNQSSLETMRTKLWLTGQGQGTKDKRLGDIPSYEELLDTANELVNKTLTEGSAQVKDVATYFETAKRIYLEGYCQPYEIAPSQAQEFFDQHRTRDICVCARRDRKLDQNASIVLKPELLRAQAVLRIVKLRSISDYSGTLYMQQIQPFVDIYIRFYNGEEVEGKPASFLRP